MQVRMYYRHAITRQQSVKHVWIDYDFYPV